MIYMEVLMSKYRIIQVSPAMLKRFPGDDDRPGNDYVVNALTKSMMKRGYSKEFPIDAWKDFILDGKRRVSAALKAGCKVWVKQWDFSTTEEAEKFLYKKSPYYVK